MSEMLTKEDYKQLAYLYDFVFSTSSPEQQKALETPYQNLKMHFIDELYEYLTSLDDWWNPIKCIERFRHNV